MERLARIFGLPFLLLALVLSPNTTALCQDDVNVKGFFDDNYVKEGPSNKRTPSSSDKSSGSVIIPKIREKPAESASERQPKDNGTVQDRAKTVSDTQPTRRRTAPGSGEKVMKRVSGVIGHAKQVLKKSDQERLEKSPERTSRQKSSRTPATVKEKDSLRTNVKAILEDGGDKQLTRPAILSLVVSAKPKHHLIKHMSDLAAVHKNKQVRVGEVLVVSDQLTPWNFLTSGILDPKGTKALAELQGEGIMIKPRIKVPERLKATYSPVWIVRYKGKDHVFEGLLSPSRLFNAKGEFLEDSVPLEDRGRSRQ